MHDDSRGRPAHTCDFNLPGGASWLRPAHVRGGSNEALICDLTARSDIEAGPRQNDLDTIAEGGRLHLAPVDDQCKNLSLDARTGVGIVLNPAFAEPALVLQAPKDASIELRILPSHLPHGFAAARGHPMNLHGRSKSLFIHVEVLFPGDIPGDLERQAIRGVKIKGAVALEHCALCGTEIVE